MDIDYEYFDKGEELFTKVAIYIYTYIQMQTKISPVFRASGVFPILTRRASPLSLSLSLCPLIKGGKVGPYPTGNEAVPDVAVSLETTSWHVEWQIMVP